MQLFAGIDVGSTATKAVVIDAHGQVVGRGIAYSGASFENAARAAFEQALAAAAMDEERVVRVVSTGYGRTNVDFAQARRTEIDCHGRGAYHAFPRRITVVDIGGQDNKVIHLDHDGTRLDFIMNRKCAAGTGAFLEEVAMRLRITTEELSTLATQSADHSVTLGSYCTVFAMTELLSKIRAGAQVQDLARAALVAVAKRVREAWSVSGEVVATGGVVAHSPLMREILAQVLDAEVLVPPHPQHVGAFGAALHAAVS